METKRVHPHPLSEQPSEFAAYETPGGHRLVVMPGLSIMERHWLSADMLDRPLPRLRRVAALLARGASSGLRPRARRLSDPPPH